MIGTRIESRRAPWLGVGLALLATAGCLAMFPVTGKTIWLCISVLPLLVAGALWLSMPRQFVADVLATGLALDDGTLIEFEKIECVLAQSMKHASFPILLVRGTRQVLIPPKLNVPTSRLFEFLLEAVPIRKKPPHDPGLAAYYQQQQQTFGEQLVWHCAGRRQIRWPRRFLRARLLCSACALAGLVYLTYGGSAPRDEMMAAGGLLMFFGLIALLITFASGSQPAAIRKNTETASVILCPVGLALSQPGIKGELSWDEIRDVRLRDREAKVTIGAESGMRRIDIVVDGAVIQIQDIYEHPLAVIHQRIVELWK